MIYQIGRLCRQRALPAQGHSARRLDSREDVKIEIVSAFCKDNSSRWVYMSDEPNDVIREADRALNICKGFLYGGKACNRNKVDNTYFCKAHQYFDTFSDEQIIEIKNLIAQACAKCHKWHFDSKKTKCNKCIGLNLITTKKRQAKIIRCRGKTRHGVECNYPVFDNSLFCVLHQYMKNYTNEQLNNLTQCVRCITYRYIIDGTACENCIKKSKKYVEKMKDKKQNIKNDKIKKSEDVITINNNILQNLSKEKSDIKPEKIISINKKNNIIVIDDSDDEDVSEYSDEKKVCELDSAFVDKNIVFINEDKKEVNNTLNNDKRCKGILEGGKKCNRYVCVDKLYCHSHIYFEKFNNLQLKDIYNLLAKNCNKCNKWHFGEKRKCDHCIKVDSTNQKKVAQKNVRCKGTERTGHKCIHRPVNNTDFCNFHQYMTYYTDEQIKNVKLCSTCKMYKFLGNFNTCEPCRKRGDENRQIHRETKTLCVYCTKYEANSSGYCGNHMVYLDYITNKMDMEIFKVKLVEKEQYRIYQRSAIQRNREFKLTFDEFITFFRKLCYYCNQIDIRGWNGIDRKINSIGYILTNCVPCCKICNKLKYTATDDIQFYTFCQNIYKNRGCTEKIDKKNDTRRKSYYSGYKKTFERHVIKKNLPFLKFNLTKEQYENILTFKCYYCAGTNDKNQIGIDRKTGLIGYTFENCQPCCGLCNKMKGIYPESIFINKIKTILEFKKLI